MRACSRKGRFLILYSHGNAESIAQLASYIEVMAECLDADVLCYEYPGYSLADGSPSEAGCYAAAMAAHAWALLPAAEGGGGASPAEIVPFGRSLGSAPAVYMASEASDIEVLQDSNDRFRDLNRAIDPFANN